MWGLVLKDIFCNKKDILMASGGVLFFTAFTLVMTFIKTELVTDMPDLVISLVQIMGYTGIFLSFSDVVTSSIAADERSFWVNFISSSPCTFIGQIQSKYCEGLIAATFCMNWCMFLSFIGYAISDVKFSNIYVEIMFIYIFILAIEIPFNIYFGSQSGKYVKIAFMVMLIMAFAIYEFYVPNADDNLHTLVDKLLNMDYSISITASLFPFISTVLYFISYKISCKLYLKGAEHFE